MATESKLYELIGTTIGEQKKPELTDKQWLKIFAIMQDLGIEPVVDGKKTRYRATSEQSVNAMAQILNTGIRVWSQDASDETIERLDRQKDIFAI